MKTNNPIMACYFRSWRDTANKSVGNKTSMAELPEEVDIAFVFPNDGETDTFWLELSSKLIPAMHAKKIKVVRTVAIEELISKDFPSNPEGYKGLARHILEKFYTPVIGLDGLDVDIERNLDGVEREKAKQVSIILREKLGKDKLFIFDTNENGDQELLASIHESLDYILFQAYGQSPSSVQAHFDRMFERFLPAEKFLVGFSFYEERGRPWGDTELPRETSTAYQYAKWNPTQGKKGGMFSYAVDRDGVVEGNDALEFTNYSWTKELKAAMK